MEQILHMRELILSDLHCNYLAFAIFSHQFDEKVPQSNFVELLRMSKKLFYVGRLLIEQEASETKTNTFMRGNNSSTRFFSIVFRDVGKAYCLEFISPIINTILADNSTSFEIFPSMCENETLAFNNLRSMLNIAQKFINSLFTSVDKVPMEMRVLMKICSNILSTKPGFEDMKLQCVGTIFFLRFICPVISSPSSYGFSEAESLAGPRARFLSLFTMVLQRLANRVTTDTTRTRGFDANLDSMVHTSVSSFVKRNSAKVLAFYEEFIQVEIPKEKEIELTSELARGLISFTNSITPKLHDLCIEIETRNSDDTEKYREDLVNLAKTDLSELIVHASMLPSTQNNAHPKPSLPIAKQSSPIDDFEYFAQQLSLKQSPSSPKSPNSNALSQTQPGTMKPHISSPPIPSKPVSAPSVKPRNLRNSFSSHNPNNQEIPLYIRQLLEIPTTNDPVKLKQIITDLQNELRKRL